MSVPLSIVFCILCFVRAIVIQMITVMILAVLYAITKISVHDYHSIAFHFISVITNNSHITIYFNTET